MTIDEAISHALEVAERQEFLSTQNHGYCDEKRNVKEREQCTECAAEHRQLVEWLRELKVYKANADGITAVSDILKEENNHLRETVNRFDSKIEESKRLLLLACADIHTLLTDAELTTKNCELCGKLSLCNESGTTCKSGGVWVHEKAVMKLIGDTDNDT